MLQSVWLTSLIIDSFSRSDSVVRSYFSYLNSFFDSDECVMFLEEPDRRGRTYIFINDHSACVLPFSKEEFPEDLILSAMKERRLKTYESKVCIPLFFDNTASFGGIIMDEPLQLPSDDTTEKAIVAFGSIIYSEAMGSITESFHPTVVDIKGLCIDYRVGKLVNRAVNNVKLRICENEFTVITGASGCGKTSMLNAIGGMLTPTEGSILWNDVDIVKLNEKKRTAYRRDDVGFVFQRYNLIGDLTAEENVEVASSIVKNALSAKEVLKMVGLEDKLKSYPSQLSGGEQQRVCIARALVKQPKILLCDEPTGALDTVNAASIIRILQTLAKEKGIAVVMITHNPNYVVCADHCLLMRNGCIVEEVFQPFALNAQDMEL